MKLKMLAWQNIGYTATMVKEYKMSIKCLKRALQYCWLLNNHKQEINIYDKLGYIYYLSGDLKSAQYYHLRSVNNLLEDVTSVPRIHSIDGIKTLQKNKGTPIKQINAYLLAKTGLIDVYDDFKFQTIKTTDELLRIIMIDNELNFILDPCLPKEQIAFGGQVKVEPEDLKLRPFYNIYKLSKKDFKLSESTFQRKNKIFKDVLP